jgi:hypothetical protein
MKMSGCRLHPDKVTFMNEEIHEQTAVEKYRALVADKPVASVQLTAPSGFVFKFKKPSKYGLIFAMNQLPQALSSGAIKAWEPDQDQEESEQAAPPKNSSSILDMMLAAGDYVLELSLEPKLVAGVAEYPDELSVSELLPDDMTFLVDWVMAGGQAGIAAATFPEGQKPSAVAGLNRKERRTAAKLAVGNGAR